MMHIICQYDCATVLFSIAQGHTRLNINARGYGFPQSVSGVYRALALTHDNTNWLFMHSSLEMPFGDVQLCVAI